MIKNCLFFFFIIILFSCTNKQQENISKSNEIVSEQDRLAPIQVTGVANLPDSLQPETIMLQTCFNTSIKTQINAYEQQFPLRGNSRSHAG